MSFKITHVSRCSEIVMQTPSAIMTPITCQVVNADHQGLPGMRVTLECSGGYQFASHMESVTNQRGITSGWTPRLGHSSSGFGPSGGYGYGGFSGWNATPRISLTFVTDRFFCIPAPWANIQACISTAATRPASHHILLRFSRDKTSYQIVHTATPLTPPAPEPSQVPAIDWNSDLYVDLTSSSPSSPFMDTSDTPSSPFIDALDTPSSLVLPSLVFTDLNESDEYPEIDPSSLKRKASCTEDEGSLKKRRFF